MNKILMALLMFVASIILTNCTPQDMGAKGNCGWFGCPEGQTSSSRPGGGQYTIATSVGVDKYMIEGSRSAEAIKGAKAHCSKLGKTMELETINDDRVAIFKCV